MDDARRRRSSALRHTGSLLACLLGVSSPALADYGQPVDLREVRTVELAAWTAFGSDAAAQGRAVTVSDVTIAGGYALCTWSAGSGGGQTILQNQRGRWVRLTQSGGILSSIDLKNYVPADVASELAKHNAETAANEAFLRGFR